MTTMPERLPQTTTTTRPDKATRRLVSMLDDPDGVLQDIVQQVGLGAGLHNECGEFDCGDDNEWTDLTAMSLAVLVDSDRHQLLLVPLLLNLGGDINQVDSKGRTLMSFAFQGPVASYLHDQGAPLEPSVVAAFAAMEDAGAPFDLAIDEPMVPDTEWETLLPAWLRDDMAAIGYFKPEVASSVLSHAGRHPLIARFSAARLLASAVYTRDASRVSRLIGLGGHTFDLRHPYAIEREGRKYFFRELTTLGLAVLIDGEEGGDDGFGGPDGEPLMLPAFASATDFLGAQDDKGNTLLHITKSPRIAEWLLRLGLPLDVKNNKGQTPLDVATAAVRAVFEQKGLDDGLAPAGSDSGTPAQKRL
ncbi:ankyrin repeat domain-containing protein [Luteibacter pinisoli]|uniref:Ankyrin repeat domain-containing protein n=1 Tax=Luteibacter pinisoli TaxID=2589080 RepID=A0A4Y5Z689_9GAMM|nr:ankyrin repeat domain-containing protein [Luteibacter pinisoli]QDE39863.1 ankyrin repeat domain-containing protein [Luteibacter pinisoli]